MIPATTGADASGLIIAVLAGRPADAGWTSVHQAAFEALQGSAARCNFPKKAAAHRRGKFPALNAGISFGGGQMAPGNLCHSAINAREIEGLTSNEAFIRIAGFASSAFAAWMPKLHNYYADHFDALLEHHPNLWRNFPNSTWAAVAFNFGPRTVTAKHRDFANLPFGVCSITSLGNYDPVKGGHIVLWELRLVVEFPPGSTVLIPSAAVAHSNTPIGEHETRGSFTQYSAGGLFRWAEHGFQKDAEFMRGLSDLEKEEVAAQNRARCKLGLSLFSTLDELRNV